MANVHIGDDVLRNIPTRLPGKPLLRFRCASKHWNRLISDPCFMKSRSRRMILLPFLRPLAAIDDNVPAEDESHSILWIPFPLEDQEGYKISPIGTFNGIVLLALFHKSLRRCQLVLYNPLTCASKVLTVMDLPFYEYYSKLNYKFVFGFGYVETTHDLKIVRFQVSKANLLYKWDVFDLKTSSWSTPPRIHYCSFILSPEKGVFVNGFLYWGVVTSCLRILALNLKEMVFSMIIRPDEIKQTMLPLGSIGECLCVINRFSETGFDVWLMKEQCDENSWMKAHSFEFAVEGDVVFPYYPICVLGNGKILFTCSTGFLVIYDTSKDSYKMLKCSETVYDSTISSTIFASKMKHHRFDHVEYMQCIEYVESLVSPSDMCFI